MFYYIVYSIILYFIIFILLLLLLLYILYILYICIYIIYIYIFIYIYNTATWTAHFLSLKRSAERAVGASPSGFFYATENNVPLPLTAPVVVRGLDFIIEDLRLHDP